MYQKVDIAVIENSANLKSNSAFFSFKSTTIYVCDMKASECNIFNVFTVTHGRISHGFSQIMVGMNMLSLSRTMIGLLSSITLFSLAVNDNFMRPGIE